MISPTFFQELFTGNIQGDFSFGRGNTKQGGVTPSGFSGVLNRLMDESANTRDAAASGKTLPTGHRFLEQLKKSIMASGISLEENQVNPEAMAEFRKLLVKAGFNSQEVQEMMSDLTSGGAGKTVTLATLFAKASQLSKPDETGGVPVFLEISTLPYIETILGRLGMDQESIQSVLADAKVEGSGIDLEKLVANIRRGMACNDCVPGTAAGNPDDIVEMMQRIGLFENKKDPLTVTLDKLIAELARLNKSKTPSTAEDGSEELSGNLLIPYLQQLAAPLGDEGKQLRHLIASAGKDGGGFDGDALLSKLVQMKQHLTSTGVTSNTTSLTGSRAETSGGGEMTLTRFVAALESKIAAESKLHGVLENSPSARGVTEMAGRFLEEITPASSNTQGKLILPSGISNGKPAETAGPPVAKEAFVQDARQVADKPATGAAGKDAPGQNISEVSRQTASGGDAGRNTSENSSGKDETAKFVDILTTAGKDKVKKTAEQNLSVADGFIRAEKSADGVSAFVKMPVNRTLPGYLLDQVSRQIAKLRAVGENEITLQLKPPHLGRMQINIEHTSGGIKVGIVVESAAAKEMLLSHTSELKAALGDQGLRLDKIDVEAQSNFGRSMAQEGREFGQTGGQSNRWIGRGLAGGGLIPEGLGPPGMVREVDAGRLDLVA